MKNLELLSPCGDFETLKAAVGAGADAVYLGGKNFNARAKANNFGDDLPEAINYAHLRGVKVYLTLNTLVYDDEFAALLNAVKEAVEAGADAFIVQDMGVAYFLKENFEDIELHLSTQGGVHNLPGALAAQKMGFKRIVLSRETTLEDIKDIKKHTTLELEFFVQGALCSSFSGNCYISSFASGDSGNRGRCAQLCRLKYTTSDKKEGYLMSTKDLCLLDKLKILSDAGIDSFKIEGRLRRAGYVATATKVYREAIDNLGSKNYNFESAKLELKKVFCRGNFNDSAYLYDNFKKLQTKFNSHTGVKIGKVSSVKKFKDIFRVEVLSEYFPVKGDGVKFFTDGEESSSAGVGNVEKIKGGFAIYTKYGVKKDDDVYLTLDKRLEQENLSFDKKTDVNFEINALKNRPIVCKCAIGSLSVSVEGAVCDKAKSLSLTADEVQRAFAKGAECFNFRLSEFKTDSVFLGKAERNELRRKAVEALKSAVLKQSRSKVKYKKKDIVLPKCNPSIRPLIVFADETEYNSLLRYDADFALCPQDYFDISTENFLKTHKAGLVLPNVATGREIAKLDTLVNLAEFVVSQNLWGLKYAGFKKVIASPMMNVFNRYAIAAFKDAGVDRCVASYEQNLKFECDYRFAAGYVPYMTFLYCPAREIYGGDCANCKIKNITYTDGRGKRYSLLRYRLNRCCFTLIGKFTNIKKISGGYVDLRGLTAAEADCVMNEKPCKAGEDIGKSEFRIN